MPNANPHCSRHLHTRPTKNREENRRDEITALTSKGIVPFEHEIEQTKGKYMKERPWLIGSVSALIKDVKPAQEIVDEMVKDAVERLNAGAALVTSVKAKL